MDMTPEERFENIEIVLDQAAKMILHHSEMLGQIDERLDRVSRHLEVLAPIVSELIRTKQDKKRR